MGHEVFQQAIFLNGKVDADLSALGAAGVAVQHEVIAGQLQCRCFPTPAEQRFDAGFEFLKAERLYQIVIRSGIQSFHYVFGSAECGEHDDRCLISFLLPVLPA